MERSFRGKEVMQLRNNNSGPPKRCPRCESTNTKFCYFNNYSQSQPRHFCRACRRYWTEGGTLRNVPQGSGSYRRGKRPRLPDPPPPPPPPPPSFMNIGGGGGDHQGGMAAPLLPPFHPGCAAMLAEFGGFVNFPFHPQLAMPPVIPQMLQLHDPGVMIQQHQQMNMNIAVFTSTTRGPTVSSSAAGGTGTGNNGGIIEEFNWIDDLNNEDGVGGSSPPPNP